MLLKLTQFPQTPATRSTVCPRCGYRMFHTKRFNWVCGPGCDGAQQQQGQMAREAGFELKTSLASEKK